MENTPQVSIFEIGINEESKMHLEEIAKWSRLLAIVGLLIAALVLIAGFAILVMGSAIFSSIMGSGSSAIGAMLGMVYIVMGFLYFFPSFKLLRFASTMPAALRSGDQIMITQAFGYLKSTFRFYGILTLIIIGIYVLALVAGSLYSSFM